MEHRLWRVNFRFNDQGVKISSEAPLRDKVHYVGLVTHFDGSVHLPKVLITHPSTSRVRCVPTGLIADPGASVKAGDSMDDRFTAQ